MEVSRNKPQNLLPHPQAFACPVPSFRKPFPPVLLGTTYFILLHSSFSLGSGCDPPPQSRRGHVRPPERERRNKVSPGESPSLTWMGWGKQEGFMEAVAFIHLTNSHALLCSRPRDGPWGIR